MRLLVAIGSLLWGLFFKQHILIFALPKTDSQVIFSALQETESCAEFESIATPQLPGAPYGSGGSDGAGDVATPQLPGAPYGSGGSDGAGDVATPQLPLCSYIPVLSRFILENEYIPQQLHSSPFCHLPLWWRQYSWQYT